jgi:hypothetical protein
VLLEEAGLDRESAVNRLKELRDRLKQGELDGNTFTIRVIAEPAGGDAG